MKQLVRRLPFVRLGAAAAMVVLAGAASAQDTAAPADAAPQPDAVVATINGEEVTEADLQIAMTDLGQQFAQVPADQRRAAALSALIEIKLLSAAAEEKGIGESDEFKRRMEMLRERALHSAYIDEEISGQITDEQLRARYDEEIAKLPKTEEVHARHILVETKEEAEAIIKQLDEGGNFEEIAKEKSTDGAAAQGGDLGYFGPGQMVPEFEQAAFAMEVGSHSAEPVQTQFGFHVIKVEDKRTQEPPAFEQVSEQFRSLILRENYVSTVSDLREAAAIEIEDAALAEALEPAAEEAAPAEGGEAAPAEEPAE